MFARIYILQLLRTFEVLIVIELVISVTNLISEELRDPAPLFWPPLKIIEQV